ncbi:MAG: hypothetical protein R3C52_01100 [Hyphomonadaceae bacterium]
MAARDAARDNARGGDGDTSSLWGRTTSGFRWLTRTPRGLLTLASAVAGSALLGVLIWNQYRAAPLLDSPDAWAWFALASLALWLPLSLLLLDKDETLAEGPRLNLPLTSLAILAGLAAIAAANQTYQWGLFGAETGQAGWPPMTPALGAFFGFLALAFLPRIASAVQFARAQAREKKQAEERTAHRRATGDAAANARAVELEDRAREQGDAEALGAFIATAAVIAIGTLAYFAAGWTDGKAFATPSASRYRPASSRCSRW